MSEMQIRTFGQTAEITVTREQVVETMNLITDVHRKIRGEAEYLCTYAHAKAITAEVKANARDSRINAKAQKLSAAGRFRRAKLALAA